MSDTDKNETKREPAPTFTRPVHVKKLMESDLSLMQSLQVIYTATPPVGTTREDMLKPIFWSHVARKLKPMFEIWAMPKDGAWYGKWLVLYADNVQAKLKELQFYSLDTLIEPDADSDPYLVKFISPPVRYGIIRKADKVVVKDRFETKELAYAWKSQNLDSLRAV